MNVGGTEQLTSTIQPSNATNQNVTWTSSNSSVATVNNNGLVTAMAAGSAIITVKTVDGNKTATCSVSVTAGSGKTKLVKEMKIGDQLSYYESWELYQFSYDDKQFLTKIRFYYSNHDSDELTLNFEYIVTYNNNQILVTGSSYDDKTRVSNTTYTLDSNGFIIRGTREGDREGNVYGPFPFFEPGLANYSYSNGHIVGASINSQTKTYTWENGNLTRIVEDFGDKGICTRTLMYNNVENKLNIGRYSFGVFDRYHYEYDGDLKTFSRSEIENFWGLFKGWKSKNFPISETWSYIEGTKSTTTYTYTFDSDGDPTKIVASSNHHEYPMHLTFTFTYY